MDEKDSQLIQNELVKIEKALLEFDYFKVDKVLDDIFHGILYAKMDAELFINTCEKCLNILNEYRKKNSLKYVLEHFNREVNILTNRTFVLDQFYFWITNEFKTTTKFLHDAKHFDYSRKTRNIINYIENNFSNKDFSLENLSQNFGISITHLSQLFKIETSQTIIEYLTKHRISESKKLLRKTAMKNYEVAESVGFSSSQYFSKVFLKHSNMTPLEYRNIKKLN